MPWISNELGVYPGPILRGKTQVAPHSEHPGVALFYALRGIGKDWWTAEGGGEAWLKKERANFYGPAKKDLE